MEKPDIDSIEGLSPAISIEQKATARNPRSTVGTVTEIYDYLRLLFARAGTPICPDHNISLEGQTSNQICDKILELPKDTKLMILAPLIKEQKGEHLHVFEELKVQGYVRMIVNGLTVDVDYKPKLNKNKKHSIEAVVDRLILPSKPDDNFKLRLAESVENALAIGDGNLVVFLLDENKDIKNPLSFATQESAFSNKSSQDLNLIIKSDVHGSSEAIKNAINQIKHDEVKPKIILADIGTVSYTHLTLPTKRIV